MKNLRTSQLTGNRERVSKLWSPDPRAQVLSYIDSRVTGSVLGRTAATANSTQRQCTLSVPGQLLLCLEDSLKFRPKTLLTHRSVLCFCACLFVSNSQEPAGKAPRAPSCRVSWLPQGQLPAVIATDSAAVSQPGDQGVQPCSGQVYPWCGAWDGGPRSPLTVARLLRLPTASRRYLKAFPPLPTCFFSPGQKRQAANLLISLLQRH